MTAHRHRTGRDRWGRPVCPCAEPTLGEELDDGALWAVGGLVVALVAIVGALLGYLARHPRQVLGFLAVAVLALVVTHAPPSALDVAQHAAGGLVTAAVGVAWPRLRRRWATRRRTGTTGGGPGREAVIADAHVPPGAVAALAVAGGLVLVAAVWVVAG